MKGKHSFWRELNTTPSINQDFVTVLQYQFIFLVINTTALIEPFILWQYLIFHPPFSKGTKDSFHKDPTNILVSEYLLSSKTKSFKLWSNNKSTITVELQEYKEWYGHGYGQSPSAIREYGRTWLIEIRSFSSVAELHYSFALSIYNLNLYSTMRLRKPWNLSPRFFFFFLWKSIILYLFI